MQDPLSIILYNCMKRKNYCLGCILVETLKSEKEDVFSWSQTMNLS